MISSYYRFNRFVYLLIVVLGILTLAPMKSVVAQDQSVTGRLTVVDRGGKTARDIGDAVIWLVPIGAGSSGWTLAPDTVQISMSDKEFRPHVVAVSAGSTVEFPNSDPFNHNVFSLSPESPFDLGLYSRGDAKGTDLNQPGIIRVYCNVHARMSAFVVVRDNPYYTQPTGDGSFVLRNVPPGRYTLHAWHERAPEHTREVTVRATSNNETLDIELDARSFRQEEHLNKYGKPYTTRGRRY